MERSSCDGTLGPPSAQLFSYLSLYLGGLAAINSSLKAVNNRQLERRFTFWPLRTLGTRLRLMRNLRIGLLKLDCRESSPSLLNVCFK